MEAMRRRAIPREILQSAMAGLKLPPLTVATARTLAPYGLGPYAGYGPDGTPLQPIQPLQPSTADRPDPTEPA